MTPDRTTGTRRRRILIGATVVVLAGAGVGIWFATKSSGAATPGITTTTSVQTVTTGTITQTVAATGTVEPASQANLNFAVSGRVTAVDVTVGQVVTAGPVPGHDRSDTSLTPRWPRPRPRWPMDQAQLATDQAGASSATQIASDKANIASAQTQVTTRPDRCPTPR